MRFPDDWAGVFIRGDNAFHYAFLVEKAAKGIKDDPMAAIQLEGLAQLLRSSREPCDATEARLT